MSIVLLLIYRINLILLIYIYVVAFLDCPLLLPQDVLQLHYMLRHKQDTNYNTKL